MRKTLINKFKTFAMLSAFVILFSSCDDSTSANEENSALKKEIAGYWELYRTCVEYNNNGNVHYCDDGISMTSATDNILVQFNKLDSITNLIQVSYYTNIPKSDNTAAWISSKTYSFPHWVIYQRDYIQYIESIKEIEIEITEINPLKGIWTERIYDSSFTTLNIFRKIEFSGKRYISNYQTNNKKVG